MKKSRAVRYPRIGSIFRIAIIEIGIDVAVDVAALIGQEVMGCFHGQAPTWADRRRLKLGQPPLLDPLLGRAVLASLNKHRLAHAVGIAIGKLLHQHGQYFISGCSQEIKPQTVAATITEHPAVHCIGVIFRSIATGSWLIRLASATSSWFGSPAV